jgi:hypothetical protein
VIRVPPGFDEELARQALGRRSAQGTAYELDSRFATLEMHAYDALTALHGFWSRLYGPNEALATAFDALAAMRETWEGVTENG